jgi:hypothetical protein
VTFQRKPDACKTLAAAGPFERSDKTTSMVTRVDGSSPSEGSAKFLQIGLSLSARFASFPACIRYGADYGAPRSATLLALASHAPKIGADGPPGPDHAAREDTVWRCSPCGRRHCYGRAATGGCHVASSGPANSVDFAIALREPGQPVRIEHDHHLFGDFPDATWRRLIDDSGLEHVDVRRRRPRCRRARGVCWSASRRPRNSGGRSRPASSAWPGRTA